MTERKGLVVKDWFAGKKFEEVKGTKLYSNSVIGIFKETEKAYQGFIGSEFNYICTWFPKSVVEEDTEDTITFVAESYEELKEQVEIIKSFYR